MSRFEPEDGGEGRIWQIHKCALENFYMCVSLHWAAIAKEGHAAGILNSTQRFLFLLVKLAFGFGLLVCGANAAPKSKAAAPSPATTSDALAMRLRPPDATEAPTPTRVARSTEDMLGPGCCVSAGTEPKGGGPIWDSCGWWWWCGWCGWWWGCACCCCGYGSGMETLR